MFSAAIVLRYKMKRHAPSVPPGQKKNGLMWFLRCLVSAAHCWRSVLGFVPPVRFRPALATVWFSVLIIGCVVVVGAPFVIYSSRKPSWKDPEAAADFAPFHWEAQSQGRSPAASHARCTAETR